MNFEKYINISKLIAKALFKDLTDSESAQLRNWLKEDPSNDSIYKRLLKKDWTKHKNASQKLDKDEIWQNIYNEIRPNQTKKAFSIYQLLKYAAAAIIIIAAGLSVIYISQDIQKEKIAEQHQIKPGKSKARLIMNDGQMLILGTKDTVLNTVDENIRIKIDSGKIEYQKKSEKMNTAELHTLKIEKGEEYELTLADGTVVKLNSETEFRFPTEFGDKERRVYLKGEAYFKVAKNASKPFILHANGMDVKVLGTEFNVSAYEDDDFIHTTLIEGKVKIHEQISGENQYAVLEPSQQAYINRSGARKLEVKTVDTDLYASWAQGKFMFKEEPLHEIFKKLSRWYNIEVFYDDTKAKYSKFSAICPRFENCETILKLMEKTNSVKFEITDNTILVMSKD